MHQRWVRDAQVPSLQLAFLYFALTSAVLNKLLSEQVDAIVVLPMHMSFWASMLQRLLIVDSHVLGFHKGLCKAWVQHGTILAF